MSHTSSRTRRIVSAISSAWAEMDHAQRRAVELQTGITGLSSRQGHNFRLHVSKGETER